MYSITLFILYMSLKTDAQIKYSYYVRIINLDAVLDLKKYTKSNKNMIFWF